MKSDGKTYYKVVYNWNGELGSLNDKLKYKQGVWLNKKSTEKGTPFFVFTTLSAAQSFADNHYDSNGTLGEVWKCHIDNGFEYDNELGHINNYKYDALFANNVMLVSRANFELKGGMVFRFKGTQKYIVYIEEDQRFIKLTGNKKEEMGSMPDDFSLEENIYQLCQQNNLVYCPNLKPVFGVEER